MRYLVWGICLLLLNNCSPERENSQRQLANDFPAPVELEGKRVFEQEYSLAQITKIDSILPKSPM